LKLHLFIITILTAVMLTACGSGSGEPNAPIELAVTDAPLTAESATMPPLPSFPPKTAEEIDAALNTLITAATAYINETENK
jgi:hypothetical protein